MEGYFEKVYNIVKDVPKGKVVTYGQIAEIIGNKRGARFVGYALRANPDPQNIPCHRVVNRFGKLANEFEFFDGKNQRQLLLEEGVVFDENGNVDMQKCMWKMGLDDIGIDF